MRRRTSGGSKPRNSETLEIEQNFPRFSGRRGSVVFEGWAAGGKGGAIQRLTVKLDPHWFRICAIGPPSPDERGGIISFAFGKSCRFPGVSRSSVAAGTAGCWSSGSKG